MPARSQPALIRPSTVLPAQREPITIITSDGLRLIGEVATPISGDRSHGILCLHPLPTYGGMMDSHIYKKAANRLPALAEITVVRFNTRGTASDQGKSEGEFGGGVTERADVVAAIEYCFNQLQIKELWVVGWSFGTDLAFQHATDARVKGLILLSPPLRTTTEEQLRFWSEDGRPVIALIPELDDYLKPDEARLRFSALKQLELIAVADAKHLWVGEPFVHRVLSEIVRIVNLGRLPLPTVY
ncbi:MAG: alpha/beta fold hydrolase [Actinobacteria bacterium]|nr:alpha/beta fold hydrolase [Actinomycetota bacterium]